MIMHFLCSMMIQIFQECLDKALHYSDFASVITICVHTVSRHLENTIWSNSMIH